MGVQATKKNNTTGSFINVQISTSARFHICMYLRANLNRMNLHEYQAKELLKKYNVPVQEGIPVDTPEKAVEAYKQLKVQTNNSFAVVKAQIHAGGRGKGKIRGTEQRGVAVAKSADDVSKIAG